jgi:RNA polymerase sigma-70 factor (ECF subfamily)
MPSSDSFDDLLARLRQGDDAAAAELLRRYAARLIALARVRLGARVRTQVDPEDVLQSAFRSFFVRCADGQFNLKDWDGLWALLVAITLHKCGHKIRDLHRACRDVRREVEPVPGDDDSARSWEAIAREPGPQEEAALADEVEALLRGLTERDRAVVSLRLQGHTLAEIATRLGLLERTVCRVLERVHNRLREQNTDAD